jgi:hypothetical protein
MKFKNASKTSMQFLAIGLFLTASSGIIKDFFYVPDFFRGAMMGLGLGFEIMGIVLLRKDNNSTYKDNDTPSSLSND